MSKRLLDYDPLTGITYTFEDLGGDDFAIHTRQDVEAILEHNKHRYNSGKDYWRGSGQDWRHEATIPIGVQYEWLTKYGIDVWNPDHEKGVVRLLNSSDYRYLKCGEIII